MYYNQFSTFPFREEHNKGGDRMNAAENISRTYEEILFLLPKAGERELKIILALLKELLKT